jgi:hypothetical protein
MAPNICTHMPPIEGPISAKEDKKPEILPRVVKSSDELETRNSNVEFHSETVGTLPESKQGHDSRATVSNTLHLTCCLYLIYYTNFYLAFNLH